MNYNVNGSGLCLVCCTVSAVSCLQETPFKVENRPFNVTQFYHIAADIILTKLRGKHKNK